MGLLMALLPGDPRYARGMTAPRAEDILAYWFADADKSPLTLAALEARPRLWFAANPEVDAHIRTTFGADVERAARGELDAWAEDSRSLLALVVLLDQFTRNIHRGTAAAFAQDPRALGFVQAGLARGVDASYNVAHCLVFYLPLMHAEDMAVQRVALAKYKALRERADASLQGMLAKPLEMAERHAFIIDKFGRYPHRNKALGRTTTPEEEEFLKQPNSSF